MKKTWVCQSFFFGFQNQRWKMGATISGEDTGDTVIVNGKEYFKQIPGEKKPRLPYWPKQFVSPDDFKQPDEGVIGGPRIDGVLTKLEKVEDTAMSPETRAMLEGAPVGEAMDAVATGEEVPASAGQETAAPVKIQRGRRLGSKNK